MVRTMKKPDFFIIGAPKCGTTALYSYLKDHPRIYFSALKEPHFFNDEDEGRHITDQSAYWKLFADAADHQIAGEASVLYLSSRSAVRKIRESIPDAKLIVMLRHPVDLFFSLHQQNLFRFRETIRDPETAWDLQSQRALGRNIPRGCRERQTLQYRYMVSLGSQIERLYAVFPKHRILMISFNDFQRNTREVYERTLSFLGAVSDGRSSFPRENGSKIHCSFLLARILAFSSFTKTSTFGRCVSRSRTRTEMSFWFSVKKMLEYLRELNTKPWQPAVDPAFAERLGRDLADEVEKVRQLTGLELRSKYEGTGDKNPVKGGL